jgi:hypothetical protein
MTSTTPIERLPKRFSISITLRQTSAPSRSVSRDFQTISSSGKAFLVRIGRKKLSSPGG